MQTTNLNDADPYWRWHDRMGLARPGNPAPLRPGGIIRKAERQTKKATVGSGLLADVRPPRSGLDKARADLFAAQKRLAELDAIRAQEWRQWASGERASPYGVTVRAWRLANVQVVYYEHVLVPHLEEIDRHPGRRHPYPFIVPGDHWGHDDFPHQIIKPRVKKKPVKAKPVAKPSDPHCHWCGRHLPAGQSTIEHLVPQWALRLSPKLKAADRRVPACRECNFAKGPMPPALFAELRRDQQLCKRHRVAWQDVAHRFADWYGEPDDLIPQIEAEMLKPITHAP